MSMIANVDILQCQIAYMFVMQFHAGFHIVFNSMHKHGLTHYSKISTIIDLYGLSALALFIFGANKFGM